MRKPPAKSKIVGKPISFATPEDAAAALFDRVASILDDARASVVRAVNSRMVLAYWLIGREIVQALQGGEERAEDGKAVIDGLSSRLTERYGDGYSATNLKSFRLFYLTYANREPIIRHALRAKSLEIETSSQKKSPVRRIRHAAGDELESRFEKSHAARAEFAAAFHPSLSWTHYRAIMRVEKPDACEFYEKEGDNPTIGLILCSQKNETVARYSVLKESRQLFATKYRLHLPTEDELARELKREILAIHEAAIEKGGRLR